MFNNKNIGNIGEDLALSFLIQNGYKILEKNFRTNFGEIDIIAQKRNTIVFIEVKTRTSIKYGYPYEAVNYRKQQKIKKVSQSYIKLNNLRNFQYRFDIIEVFINGNYKINHIENAFWV